MSTLLDTWDTPSRRARSCLSLDVARSGSRPSASLARWAGSRRSAWRRYGRRRASGPRGSSRPAPRRRGAHPRACRGNDRWSSSPRWGHRERRPGSRHSRPAQLALQVAAPTSCAVAAGKQDALSITSSPRAISPFGVANTTLSPACASTCQLTATSLGSKSTDGVGIKI